MPWFLQRWKMKSNTFRLLSCYLNSLSSFLLFFSLPLVTKLYRLLQPPGLCSPPGSSVHRILQARILEWVAMSFSRGSSRPRNWTQASCTAGRFLTNWARREAHFVVTNQVSENGKYQHSPIGWEPRACLHSRWMACGPSSPGKARESHPALCSL